MAYKKGDRVDVKDLIQMFIGSLAVLTIYMVRQEYTMIANLQVFLFVLLALVMLKVLMRRGRGLPAFGGVGSSHMIYGFLMSVFVSFVIGSIILGYDVWFVFQIAIGVLPATLLVDLLAGE